MGQARFSTANERILSEIKREIPREKYGHKEIIWNPIYIDIFHSCLAVLKKRGDCQNGYDCGDASLKVKTMLEENGIKSSVVEGTSEDGIFYSSRGHKFVVVDGTDIIVDAVPLYPLLGAKHIITEKITDEKLQRISDIVGLENFVLNFQEKDNRKYLTAAAVKGIYCDENDKATDSVWVDITRKRETPEEACRIIARPNEHNIRKLFRNGLNPITKEYSLDEAAERLEILEAKEAVSIEKIGWDLTLKEIGNVDAKLKDFKYVNEDLEKLLLENTKEFVHLIEFASLA
jgi:hypothetical protein